MKVKIINLASGTINIHSADCGDCKKDMQQARAAGGYGYDIEASSQLDVSKEVWYDHIKEGSMTAEDGLGELTFKPCCRALPVS